MSRVDKSVLYVVLMRALINLLCYFQNLVLLPTLPSKIEAKQVTGCYNIKLYKSICIWPMIKLSTLSLILVDEHHSLTYYEAINYPTHL